MRGSKPARGPRPFFSDKRGNVAVVAALSMGPICVAGLGAIDLARATSAKSQLQDALDAAALAAARTNSTTDAQLTTAGDRYLKQNLKLSQDFVLKSDSFKFGENGKVTGTAQLTVVPFIAGMVTGGTMTVAASTEVVRAGAKLEIALVLDTTGSMNEGTKLADMQAAAKTFIAQMEDISNKAIEPNMVKIAIVPFANAVRVDGTTYKTAAWLDTAGSSPINDEIFTTATGTQHANRMTLFATLGTSWRGCVEMRQAPYDVDGTPPTTGATLYTPYFAPDEPDKKTSGYGDDYDNDYLSDGTSSSNWRVRQGSITKYKSTSGLGTTKGPNKGCGMAKVVRLSTDFTSLKSTIDGFSASGNTNIPMGLAWGWNMVAPGAPFSDGAPYTDDKTKKIIVLMTDGENTIDQRDTPNDGTYAGTGYIWQRRVLKSDGVGLTNGASDAERTAALDSRLALLCTNIKNKKIEIFTMRVEVASGSSTLLKNCASGDDHYYDVKDSKTLTAVFQSVAGQIAALHLSK